MTIEEHLIALRSIPSERFQPTGYPDLGPATYEQVGTDGAITKMCLVEAAQSMANHLESQGWDAQANQPLAPLDAVPWVRAVAENGDYLTSSRTAPHRLYDANLRDSMLGSGPYLDVLCERMGLKKGRPMDRRRVARVIFQLDPLTLVHGGFFPVKDWPHHIKLLRAITAEIEAADVRDVHFGGVKTDDVSPGHREGKGSREGYGMVPYHRTEYTAAKITLQVTLDIGGLRSYGLSDEATNLLETIARWELASLLSQPMRLRTRCIFEADTQDVPGAFADLSGLAERITQLSRVCPELEGVASVTEVVERSKGKR